MIEISPWLRCKINKYFLILCLFILQVHMACDLFWWMAMPDQSTECAWSCRFWLCHRQGMDVSMDRYTVQMMRPYQKGQVNSAIIARQFKWVACWTTAVQSMNTDFTGLKRERAGSIISVQSHKLWIDLTQCHNNTKSFVLKMPDLCMF